MRNLLVDLGHSSKFSGANGFKSEVLWTRSIWFSLRGLLDTKKWNVVQVPESYPWDITSNINLVHRINWINKNCHDGDWLFSIHGNGAVNPHVRGVTTCYMGGSAYMQRQAKALSVEYSKATGIPMFGDGTFDDRMGRFHRIGMLRDTRPPALLIEAGFVSNKEDMDVEPAQAAKGIAMFWNMF
jgi:N-acetylmuramoyl-L-alanine amidase